MKLSTILATGLILLASAPMALAGHHEGGDHKSDWFAKVDTDGNGTISKAEFLAKHEKKFNKMDANGDGEISKEEKMGGMKKMKHMKDKAKGAEQKAEEEY